MSTQHTPAADSKLQALWDAHRELTAAHNRLHAAGCGIACKRVATAMRSVNAMWAAENKRLYETAAKATGSTT